MEPWLINEIKFAYIKIYKHSLPTSTFKSIQESFNFWGGSPRIIFRPDGLAEYREALDLVLLRPEHVQNLIDRCTTITPLKYISTHVNYVVRSSSMLSIIFMKTDIFT